MPFGDGRCDNDPPKKPVQGAGQDDIGVMQLHHGKHERFIQDQFPQAQPKQENDGNSKDRREENFSEMKTMRRSNIHFGIGMMSAMESPEKIDPMVCAMPPIHP